MDDLLHSASVEDLGPRREYMLNTREAATLDRARFIRDALSLRIRQSALERDLATTPVHQKIRLQCRIVKMHRALDVCEEILTDLHHEFGLIENEN